jgi:GTP-binding protein
VEPGSEVYEGMVVGENSRQEDMDVNITKEKQLTNMRAASADSFVGLNTTKNLSLEESLEFAREDECVEITSGFIRIRKVLLEKGARGKVKK